jgi:hypothetical protein
MEMPAKVEPASPLAHVMLPEAPELPPHALAPVVSVADFLFRLGYFLFIPFVIYFVSLVFPLLGALINLGLALAFFAAGPLLRPLIAKRPWVGKPLKKFLKFEAYYREHPPRMFVYYLFYPLLFPYWLFVKRARQEFLLYRGLSMVAFLILIGLALFQYFTKWQPELGFGVFVVVFGMVFVIQGIVVLALMMPMATTVITYHMARKNKRLVVLLLASTVSASGAAYMHSKKRHDIVPAMTMARLNARTAVDQKRAGEAWHAALNAAVKTQNFDRDNDAKKDVEGGIEILGAPLENARAELAKFYKEDEADAFDLAVVHSDRYGWLAILFVPNGNRGPMWLAMDRHGQVTTDAAKLPTGALDVLTKFSKK